MEAETGFRLPEPYSNVLRERNGGGLVNDCFRTGFRSIWGGDDFQIGLLLGIGPAEVPIEWQIPVRGLLISSTPSGQD